MSFSFVVVVFVLFFKVEKWVYRAQCAICKKEKKKKKVAMTIVSESSRVVNYY